MSQSAGNARRDLVIHHLVAIDAQMRRIRGLAGTIGNAVELKARIVPLLDETCKRCHVLMSLIGQQEGVQHDPSAPNGG
jgi:hypothetical protein